MLLFKASHEGVALHSNEADLALQYSSTSYTNLLEQQKNFNNISNQHVIIMSISISSVWCFYHKYFSLWLDWKGWLDWVVFHGSFDVNCYLEINYIQNLHGLRRCFFRLFESKLSIWIWFMFNTIVCVVYVGYTGENISICRSYSK